jgi:uncharacterized membrane protein YukC
MNIIMIVLISVVVLVLIYIIINLLRKNEKQEDIIESQIQILESYMEYLSKISTIIEVSDERLKEIGATKLFESDDEIGWFFEQITTIQETLNSFKIKNL